MLRVGPRARPAARASRAGAEQAALSLSRGVAYYRAAMNCVLNIAGYKFVPLATPDLLRGELEAAGRTAGLRGTVLLAQEGINLCLAGLPEGITRFTGILRAYPEFTDVVFKHSWSDALPFRRLRVRVRPEIIRLDDSTIRPAAGRAPVVDAATLKRWLDQGSDDEGRPLLMFDTRNDYEVAAGRFSGALDLQLRKFSDFPDAVERVRERLDGHAVVSYCTGGIRCEKASLYLSKVGVRHHWQLDGGILGYFEAVGAAHFDGHCTVFDERSALDPNLRPAGVS